MTIRKIETAGLLAAPDNIPAAEKLKLWVRSAGRCAICNKYLLEDEYRHLPIPSGEMAHNVGRSTSARSPRGDHPLPVDQRNLADNLLLLCPDHHSLIDSMLGRDEFPVARLRAIKEAHEDRIRRLTEINDDEQTVVVRLIGDIRGTAPAAGAETVRLTVATDGRYPRFELGARSASDVEIDLRPIPGEGANYHWQAVEAAVREASQRLDEALARGLVKHLSVFAFGRIPALVLLGDQLDDKTPATIYQYADGAWAWPETGDPVGFVVERLAGETGDRQVTILLSLSGSIDLARVPAELRAGCVYELRPDGVMPNRDLLRAQESLRNFAAAWRNFLSRVEADHKGATQLHVVPAVPLSAAVEIGRARTRHVHPPLVIWDRDENTYRRTLEIAP